MPLHQRRRLQRPGLPELVALLLVALAVVPAGLWWQRNTRPDYSKTAGRVKECEIRLTHYNATNLLKKVRLEIAVNQDFVERTINAIVEGARTGEIGDGKIFVLELAECVRIRTGERGHNAIG